MFSETLLLFNKAEIDIFLEFCCFFDDPVDVGNLISGSSAFSKNRLEHRDAKYLMLWIVPSNEELIFLKCQ